MKQYLAILGREPVISIAELERVCGADGLSPFDSAVILEEEPDLSIIGGCPKVGEVVQEMDSGGRLDTTIIDLVDGLTKNNSERISLGLSLYNTKYQAREISQLTVRIAKKLRAQGVRIRAIPNPETALNA